MTQARKRRLRVGVAGLGFGSAVHVPALLAQPEVDVLAIASRSTGRAVETAEKLGIEHGCGSIDELLDLDLDAVTLALPPDQTEPAVRAALRKGVAVLCEKPLGTDAAAAGELAALADGQVTAMDFIFRETETFAQLKQLIDSQSLGKVRHVDVLWLVESWANKHRKWSWKTDADRGGGVIVLLGAHLLYLAEWLLGRATTVSGYACEPVASAFAPAGARAAEDLVNLQMGFNDGACFSATFGNANPGIAVHRWTVVFERGTAVLENIGADYVAGLTLTVRDRSGERMLVREPPASGDGRVPAFCRLLRRFLDGVRSGKPVSPDLSAGARVQELDAALRASAVDGVAAMVEGSRWSPMSPLSGRGRASVE